MAEGSPIIGSLHGLTISMLTLAYSSHSAISVGCCTFFAVYATVTLGIFQIMIWILYGCY